MPLDDYEAVLADKEIDSKTFSLDDGGTLLAPPSLERADVASLPSLVDGGLELGETIGHGGFGVVRAGRQTALDRETAVKLLPASRDVPQYREQLLREAWVTGRLEHPNIVPVYALGRDDAGRPAFVMRYLRGTPYSEVIRHPELHGDLVDDRDPIDFHLDVCDAVCRAVHYAHSEGVLHRDLKPDNVMVGQFGEVYVLDWGMAVRLSEDVPGPLPLATEIRHVEGTPGFMAPEMAEVGEIGTAADIFQLGALLYRALCSRRLFDGPDLMATLRATWECAPPEFPEHVPAGLQAIVRRAVAKQPGDRYPDVEALRRALATWRTHRASQEITERADRRRERLQGILAADRDDAALVTRVGTEALFGYREALRTWRDNAPAQRGLHQVVTTMVTYAIDRRDGALAQVWLEAFGPEPPAEWTERVRALQETLAREERRLATLAREEDPRVGARARARATVRTGAVAVAFSLCAWTGLQLTGQEGSYGLLLAMQVPFVALLALVSRLRSARHSRASRRLAHLFVVATGGLLVCTGMSWLLGLSAGQALALCLAYASVQTLILAGLSARSAWWGAPAYLVASLATVRWPAHGWLFTAGAAAIAFAAVHATWRHLPARAPLKGEEEPGDPGS